MNDNSRFTTCFCAVFLTIAFSVYFTYKSCSESTSKIKSETIVKHIYYIRFKDGRLFEIDRNEDIKREEKERNE